MAELVPRWRDIGRFELVHVDEEEVVDVPDLISVCPRFGRCSTYICRKGGNNGVLITQRQVTVPQILTG